MTITYKIDCIRNNDGTPVVSSNPRATLWFVQRISDGAHMAQCKTRESAARALAKRIEKEAAI